MCKVCREVTKPTNKGPNDHLQGLDLLYLCKSPKAIERVGNYVNCKFVIHCVQLGVVPM